MGGHTDTSAPRPAKIPSPFAMVDTGCTWLTVRLSRLTLLSGPRDELHQGRRRGVLADDLDDAPPLELRHVFVRKYTTDDDWNLGGPRRLEHLQDTRHEGHVRPRQAADAHHVDIFLNGSGHALFRRPMEARIDDLHPSVA